MAALDTQVGLCSSSVKAASRGAATSAIPSIGVVTHEQPWVVKEQRT